MKIHPLKNEDLPKIADLHIEALNGDFLTLLGKNFLTQLYKPLINNKDFDGFYVEKDSQTAGFILGTRASKSLFKTALTSNLFGLLTSLFISLIKNPLLLKNTFETILYTKKDQGPDAELVIIAISKKFQNQGIGKKLISKLEEKFKQKKIKQYKLTVHAQKPAVKFYESLKFKKIGNFTLYNKEWLIYEKNLK